MAGKTSVPQLEQRIQCIKFTIFCLNAIIWVSVKIESNMVTFN